MHTQNKIDTLDEALRVIFLEGAKDAPETADAEMQLILSSPSDIAMSEDKKAMLIQKLNTVIVSFSFGQLLQQAMHNLNVTEEVIAEKSKIPVSVVADLKNDAIYTNNVPIVLFKNLLSALGLSFKPVETAMRKTFEILQNQVAVRGDNPSGFSPAFRKGYYTSRESFTKNSPKTDGKELFENKEALEKYLSRLNELMNS
jgi:hypothetical protein